MYDYFAETLEASICVAGLTTLTDNSAKILTFLFLQYIEQKLQTSVFELHCLNTEKKRKYERAHIDTVFEMVRFLAFV